MSEAVDASLPVERSFKGPSPKNKQRIAGIKEMLKHYKRLLYSDTGTEDQRQ